MTVYPGRGAWTSVGKDNGAINYIYIARKPNDGSTPLKSINHAAVNLGVLAIQMRINALGYLPTMVQDGDLGPATTKGIKWVQSLFGLVSDGECGPKTCKALWLPLISMFENSYGIPGHHMYGIAMHESLLDPGAVGASTPNDRGLMQWNTENSGLSVQQAHDTYYALTKAASRIRAAQLKYAGKGSTLQTKCSIAQWNAPAWADQWYTTGSAPNDSITKYVSDVLLAASTF